MIINQTDCDDGYVVTVGRFPESKAYYYEVTKDGELIDYDYTFSDPNMANGHALIRVSRFKKIEKKR